MKKSERTPLFINETASSIDELETHLFFKRSEKSHKNKSPIDLFWDNVLELNQLIKLVKTHPSLNQLILLGYVSAAESYFRQLFCSIIDIDKGARETCYSHDLSYGAALAQIENPELLPEALLERHTLVSKEKIVEIIKKYIGVKGNIQDELDTSLDAFGNICQLRHCAVHRFGRLGSKNAIILGMDSHRDIIEQPLKITTDDLYKIAAVCTNVVKVMNNTLFDLLLHRTVVEKSIDWQWDLSNDKKNFRPYFNLFYSKKFSPGKEFSLNYLYNVFKSNYD